MVAPRESLGTHVAPRVLDSATFDACAEWIVGALLVFAPLAFGATQAWSQVVLFALIGLATLCVLAKWLCDRSTSLVWTWACLPMGLFLLLCIAQLISLPASLVGTISPGTVNLKRELLQNHPDLSSLLGHLTLSFYPAASMTQLRLVLAVIAMFFVVVNVYRDPGRIRRLLLVISIVGLVVALLAAYQNISGADSLYGLVPAGHRNSGPFMNYSHFGQFMNLSVGAALGLILVRWAQLAQRSEGIAPFLAEFQGIRHWSNWLLVALCVLGPITVFLSMTRMGMLSLMISGALLAVMVAWRGRKEGRGTVLFALGVVVLGALLCFGFDAVYDRLATLRNVHAAEGGRTQMLRDIGLEVRNFPILGAGLGTHEFIFPMFDRSNVPLIATHAENEYAQLLEECGIAGLLLGASFIAFLVINYVKSVWRPRSAVQYAAFGIGFGLAAILIHSSSDFGQHVPANALLTATFAALLYTLALRPWASVAATRNPAVTPAASPAPLAASPGGLAIFAWRGIAFAVVVLVCVAIIAVAENARRAEAQWGSAKLIADKLQLAGWRGEDSEFVELLKHASAAAQLAPRDVMYQYELNAFRWRTLSRNVDPATHGVVLTAVSIPFVSRIVTELQSARTLCPAFGPVLSLAGALNLEVLNQPAGAGEIQLGFRLSPYDAMACLSAGRLALYRQDWATAQMALGRYTALEGSAREAIDLLLGAGKPEMAYDLARGNRHDLQRLANDLRRDPAQTALAKRSQDKATNLLIAEASAAEAPAEVVAELAASYQAAGNSARAVDCYQRALNLDYGQVGWRLRLAQLFVEAGRSADAAREARICLRLRPQSSEARTLLAASVRDSTPGETDSVAHP
jgi:O-antigen ligase/tetratricopeptide (TPR) repeat protein